MQFRVGIAEGGGSGEEERGNVSYLPFSRNINSCNITNPSIEGERDRDRDSDHQNHSNCCTYCKLFNMKEIIGIGVGIVLFYVKMSLQHACLCCQINSW